MTDYLTNEQLDALEQIIDMAIERRTSWDHVTVFVSMKKVIAELHAERAAHQATKAELEQLRARLELIPAMAKEHESKGANDPFALATGIALRHVYAALKGIEISDAARAGQERNHG